MGSVRDLVFPTYRRNMYTYIKCTSHARNNLSGSYCEADKRCEKYNMEVLYELSHNECLKYRPTSEFYLKRPRVINILQREEDNFIYPPQMKYFKKPDVTAYPLDLNKSLERHVFRNGEFYRLQFIEEHIMQNNFPSDFDSEGKIKVCMARSLLIDIMLAPVDERLGDFSFGATKHNGILYLTDNYRKSGCTPSETHHYKLQQYCLADEPDGEADPEMGFDENKDLIAIHRSQLNTFDILYSSRICGVDAAGSVMNMTDFDSINKRKFIMTKVLMPNDKLESSRKVQKCWVQAYWGNVTEIYFGFKGFRDALIKTPLKKVLAKDLPMMKNFQPHACNQFVQQILTMVDEKMSTINCPYTVCQLQFDSKQRCFRYKIHEGKNKFSFLTEDFINYLKNRV